MARSVFCYGSLMFANVWQGVVCGRYQALPAVIRGYQRLCISDARYPALVLDQSASPESVAIAGVLYRDVQAGDLQRLDHFEGDEYQRISGEVQLTTDDHKEIVTADFYLWRNHHQHRLLDKPWCPSTFARHHLALFE